ncbi:hypothetical protein FPV67DRAFT_1477170 [Lyophyllum atratum]|nr:hypothetical protein FPV67DRAFT_1477170 [Lyophyllum atratum]
MSTPNKRPYSKSKSTWRQQTDPLCLVLAVPLVRLPISFRLAHSITTSAAQHTNSTLRSRITAFQTHLFQPGAHPDGTRKAPIRGLDKSIVIDPMRFHLTLGVMALEEEAGIEDEQDSARKVDLQHPDAPPPGTPHSCASPAPISPPLAERQNPHQPPPKGAPHPFTSPTRTSPPVAERQNSPQPPPPDLPHPHVSPEHDATGSIDPPQPNAPPPGPPHPSTSPPPTSPPPKPPQPPRTLELRVTMDSLDIMRPVKFKAPKPPRPKKPPQTSTSEPNDPQPAVGGSDAGQETAAAADGDVGQPVSSVAGNDEEGGMGGPTVLAGVDVVRGPDPDDVWAEVMYLAPRETGEDGQKLRRVADLVNWTFRREGYVVEKRALKLHCTVLNTSKRRPARTRGQPFSYSDLLRSDALRLLGATPPDPDHLERESDCHLDLDLDHHDGHAQPYSAPEDIPKGAATGIDRIRP